MPTTPSKALETFPNPEPGRDYIIEIETPEFTCLCPKTGQPDFATLELEYVPDQLCVELKSLKLYIWSYRDEGAFHEKVTNTILNDIVNATQPKYARLKARFNVRGGITTSVEAQYRRPGWVPAPPRPDLPREIQRATLADTTPTPEPAPASAPAAAKAPPAKPAKLKLETPPAAPRAPADTEPTTRPMSRTERFRMLRRNRAGVTDTTDAATAVAPAAAGKASAPPVPAGPPRDVYLGIDFGSTGCRVVAIDEAGGIIGQANAPLPASTQAGDQITQDPMQWWKALVACLQNLFTQLDAKRVKRLAVDGTSATVLLCDKQGNPVTPALMYNDRRAKAEAERIAAVASEACGAHGVTGSLAKLLWLQNTKSQQRAAYVLHQADWISNRLTGSFGHSDYNNCLKLGYDAQTGRWPDWLGELSINETWLPTVHAPGDILGTLNAEMAKTFGLPPDTEVAAGTSDGVAAFLAAGAIEPGDAVTSLGTTLVLKLLSTKAVFSSEHGVYSHRLGNRWLAGGASNSGGAVLLQYFNEDQLREMAPLLDPENPTGLDYYPLPDVGERFPISNPNMEPRLEPLPGDSVLFLQGMLEGIARIEAQGYQLLADLGAPTLKRAFTTGGGSRNPAWTRIRERTLGIRLQRPKSEHAAYGAALLAAGIVAKAFQ